MPRLYPPSRVDPLTFPVFGMDWWADPASGFTVAAYTGGGGSAKTGVNNCIVIRRCRDLDDDTRIPTGDMVGIALKMYQNPVTQRLWMIVSFSKEIRRYAMPEGTLNGTVQVNSPPQAGTSQDQSMDGCDAISINAMTNRVALGLESGVIRIYENSDEEFSSTVLFECEGHSKSVCAIDFSMHGSLLLSSAKDGTARVWNAESGDCVAEMLCDCTDPKEPPPKRPPQILVRGAAFCDLQGKLALTVASARRGRAYIFRWQFHPDEGYLCVSRTECSTCPISAMSISQDAQLLALGGVDGSVILWSNTEDWRAIKTFPEVHQLPVTCIAVRPYAVPLQGDDGVRVDAMSASADSKLGLLTMQRNVPKRESGAGSGGVGLLVLIHRLIVVVFWLWILYPVWDEFQKKCRPTWSSVATQTSVFLLCIKDEVLLAPSYRHGVASYPY
jgi:WD domain, G-beta repeat